MAGAAGRVSAREESSVHGALWVWEVILWTVGTQRTLGSAWFLRGE